MSFLWKRFLLSVAFLLSAMPAFAQEAVASGGSNALKYVGAGLAIGLAVIGGGTGQGRAAAAAFEGIGRNPQSQEKVFTPLLIGLALIEFQTIMAFIVAILIIFF